MRPGVSSALEKTCLMNVRLLFALLCAPLTAAAEPAVRPEIRRLLPEKLIGQTASSSVAAPSVEPQRLPDFISPLWRRWTKAGQGTGSSWK